MKRLKKAILLPVRSLAYRWNRLKLYYWAEANLYELRTVNVMPSLYYQWLYQLSMSMVKSKKVSAAGVPGDTHDPIQYSIQHGITLCSH
jgi:hypothetical protein